MCIFKETVFVELKFDTKTTFKIVILIEKNNMCNECIAWLKNPPVTVKFDYTNFLFWGGPWYIALFRVATTSDDKIMTLRIPLCNTEEIRFTLYDPNFNITLGAYQGILKRKNLGERYSLLTRLTGDNIPVTLFWSKSTPDEISKFGESVIDMKPNNPKQFFHLEE